MFASTTDTQIMLSQKISIPPLPQKGLEIPGRVGSQGPQNLKQCMKPQAAQTRCMWSSFKNRKG